MLPLIGAAFAVLAAILWLSSALIRLPKDVGLVTVHTNKPPAAGALVGGVAYSVGLDALGKAMSRQSRLSAYAAICAGISALCEAIPVFLNISL